MSVEEAVRRKHAFQRALKGYLQFVSVMSREEIELSVGRLADLLNSSEDEAEALHVSVKGVVLNIYLDLRNAGVKKQSKAKRVTLLPAMNRFFVERGRSKHTSAMQRYRAARQHHKERMSAWQKHVESLSFMKRWFGVRPPRPAAPSLPAPVGLFVKQSKANADMSEYLIASAANFHLLSVPQRAEDVRRANVEQLAP